MSCVAEAKAVTTKSISVKVKRLTGVAVAEITSGEGCGMENVSKMKAILITICIMTIHQRLVRRMSTKGLHRGLITQGK